ncbi:UNVERIFIED_CONTAM: hypothetical protein HDU68_009289 [Siphonaria sp. JEL0065]|nr:hypothetical protein HDU68_009289 [Siphonaria sp. JEL0065]
MTVTIPSTIVRNRFLKALPIGTIYKDPRNEHHYEVQERKINTTLSKVGVPYFGSNEPTLIEVPDKWMKMVNPTQNGRSSILAPVLMFRFRRDIIDTTHLPPAEAAEFWAAFTALEIAFQQECNQDRNKFLLPERTLLFLDNQTFVHRRSRVHDSNRLLWRIRYDPEQRPELDRVLLAASAHLWYKNDSQDWRNLATWHIQDKLHLQKNIAESFETEFRGCGGLYWSPTGGTTTSNVAAHLAVMPSTNAENIVQRSMLRNLYYKFGLLDSDTVCVNLFASGNLVRSMEVQAEILVGADATQLALGSLSTDADAIACCLHFGGTMLMGWGSRLVQLATSCVAANAVLSTVRTVVHGGEVLSTKQRALIRRVCHPECRLFAIYGSAECGVFALGESDGNRPEQYQVLEDCVHLEIVSGGLDDDSPIVTVPDGEFGRLVGTNLLRTQHPLVRFDTGDAVRFVSSARDVIEVRGRHALSTAMPFGEAMVTWDQICEVMGAEFGSALFQLWVMEGKSGGLSVVQCAVFSSETVDVTNATERLNALFKKGETFVEDASVIVLDDPGLLHRSERSGKLRHFVDLRK